MSSLPYELVELILDTLAEDRLALRACSLAAHLLLHAAQSRLLKRITIYPPSSQSGRSCHQLLKLLETSPHVSCMVQKLTVVLAQFALDCDPQIGEFLDRQPLPWVSTDPSLGHVIDSFVNLRSLSLVESTPQGWSKRGVYSMRWDALPAGTQAALTRAFARLESVRIRGLVIESPLCLLRLFSASTALKSLSFSRIYFTMPEKCKEEVEKWTPCLERLLLSDWCAHPVSALFVSGRGVNLIRGVKVLSIATESKADMTQILAEVDTTAVVSLKLTFAVDAIELSSPHLRILHVFESHLIGALSSVFGRVPEGSMLETIIIEGPHPAFGLDLGTYFQQTLIPGLSRMPRLTSVELRAFSTAGPLEFEAWRTCALRLLTVLGRRLKITRVPAPESMKTPSWSFE